jgi:hypothetical protein
MMGSEENKNKEGKPKSLLYQITIKKGVYQVFNLLVIVSNRDDIYQVTKTI